ncbi:MAG: zf-HC2 domain-containing protein [Vicinamibacterales bacterium]
MECRDVRELLDAFVDEEVLVETTRAIEAHLERCPACRAEVQDVRRLKARVRAAVTGAPALAAREAFVSDVTARLRGEAERAPSPGARRAWLALAAAAVLAVGVALGLGQWTSRSWMALVLAAAGDHRYCALFHRLEEAPIPLADAAERFGGAHQQMAAVELPATAGSGEPLEVVDRHSCVFDGRRFVHVVLRYKGELVSLLVTDDPRPALVAWGGAADGVAVPGAASSDYRMASFTSGRQAAFVVSTLAEADVMDVARAVAPVVTRAVGGA